MEKKPISVSTLAGYIKRIFDAESLLYNIDVIGEVSSYSISNGNAFFVIKDEEAILNCVLFQANSCYRPQIGDKVIVTGTPRYYVKGGKLNFNAISIKPFGEGDLYKRFIELKNRLEKEGLFAVEHKKPMPKKVDRIGVVTSETGAVIHDIINIISRRSSSQDIVLYPIKVQGVGAEYEIANGIDFFSQYDNVDAVIIARGGGSDEDLQNFNTEIVVRAVYNCNKFIISAVGHETDYTLCDYASDLRAPTPSAAAELLTKDRGDRKGALTLLMQNITTAMQNKVLLKNMELSGIYDRLLNVTQIYIKSKQNEIDTIGAKLKQCNPNVILQLGYAKVSLSSDGTVVDSAKQLKSGQLIDVYFSDGKIKAEVKDGKWYGLWEKYRNIEWNYWKAI